MNVAELRASPFHYDRAFSRAYKGNLTNWTSPISKKCTPHWRVLLLSFGKMTCLDAGRVSTFPKVGSSAQLFPEHLQTVVSWRQAELIHFSQRNSTPQTHIPSAFAPEKPNYGACSVQDPSVRTANLMWWHASVIGQPSCDFMPVAALRHAMW